MSYIPLGIRSEGGFYRQPTLAPYVPPDPEDVLPPFIENLLVNSRLAGGGIDWPARNGEVPADYIESSTPDHMAVHCISSGADRQWINQELLLSPGRTYFFSIHCAAVADATDAGREVISIAPAASVTFISTRPKLGEMVPGDRFHFVFTVSEERNYNLIIGLGPQSGSGGGDVTLERPQLERDAYRQYGATNPSASEPQIPDGIDFEREPYWGEWEGQIRGLSTQQNSMRIQAGYYGWAYTVRRTGTIQVMQHQIASNHATGETSKSTFGGSTNHGRPAAFPLGMHVFNATANWQITGDPLRDIKWTYTNTNGGQGQTDGHARVIFEHVLNLPVTAGQRLLFLVYNRHADPTNNCPSVNMMANQEVRPAFGQNPPISVSRYYGDDPTYIRADSRTGTLSRSGDRLYNLGIRYSDGVEDGCVAIDSNSNFTASIGGSNRIRQRFSRAGRFRKTGTQLAIAVLRNGTPANGLTVRLTGPDITASEVTIPVNSIPRRNTDEHRHILVDFPERTLTPGTVYTVECSSPGSASGAYTMHALRHSFNMMANSSVSTGSFVSSGPIDPHKWSGLAEQSSNGGSSWVGVGYGDNPAPSADWPIAFRTNKKIALTLGALEDVSAPQVPTVLFENPFSAQSAHHRPIGSGMAYLGTGHATYTQGLAKGNTFFFNAGNPFGHSIVRAKNNDPLVTVHWNNSQTGLNLPAQIRVPANFKPERVPRPDGGFRDSAATIYNEDADQAFMFYNFAWVPGNNRYEAAILRPWISFQGLGHGTVDGERLGTSATGVAGPFGILRGWELTQPGASINHCLQLVMPADPGTSMMLGKLGHNGLPRILPATSQDNAATSNANYAIGPIPYGALIAMPPPDKGGPSKGSLNLSAVGERLYDCLVAYGARAVDKGGNVNGAIRCDQDFPENLRSTLNNDITKMYPHLRVCNFDMSQWTPNSTAPFGGGTPRGPNRAYNA